MSETPFEEPQKEKDIETNADGEQKDPCENIFKSVGNALKAGTQEARKKAEESAPTIKSAIGKAAYALSYGAAYGGSFGLTLLKELVPDPLKEGGSDGFSAGKDAAKKAMTPKKKSATDDGDVIVDAEYSVS